MERDFIMLEKVLAAGGREVLDRLREQDLEIEAAAACTRPEIGRLVEAHYVPLLLSILALSDQRFDAEYAGEGRVPLEIRKALSEAIVAHSQECPRCGIKYASDFEWDAHLEEIRKAQRRVRIYA
ncbi:MAG TPA: hypothetical protein VF591_04970 [Pyrinomonadaceae bacterium]|jgi:hypothetical protein